MFTTLLSTVGLVAAVVTARAIGTVVGQLYVEIATTLFKK